MPATPINGVVCDVIAGQQQVANLGGGADCAVFAGQLDSATETMVLHAINYSNLTTDNPAGQNTIPIGSVGSMSRQVSAIRAVYTPDASLPVGTRLHWDIHAKVFDGWAGEAANLAGLPDATLYNGSYGFNQSDSQYYRSDGTNWLSRGGNPTASSGDAVTDVFGYVIFNIAQSQATGTSAFEALHQAVDAPASQNTQFVIAGTGSAAQDTYRNGSAPVALRASDTIALAAGGSLPYSAAASSLATQGTEGTLVKVTDTTVEYQASGNETIGDEIVFNLVWLDANGNIVYSSLRVIITAAVTGVGGTGDPISFNTASLPTSTARRETSPGEVIDLRPYLNNSSGPGIIGITNPVNVLAADISINNATRSMIISKASGGDYQFDFTVI